TTLYRPLPSSTTLYRPLPSSTALYRPLPYPLNAQDPLGQARLPAGVGHHELDGVGATSSVLVRHRGRRRRNRRRAVSEAPAVAHDPVVVRRAARVEVALAPEATIREAGMWRMVGDGWRWLGRDC